jgi:hypothetical protein
MDHDDPIEEEIQDVVSAALLSEYGVPESGPAPVEIIERANWTQAEMVIRYLRGSGYDVVSIVRRDP